MTERKKEKRPAPTVPTRTPGKRDTGIFANLRTPSQIHPVEEILQLPPAQGRLPVPEDAPVSETSPVSETAPVLQTAQVPQTEAPKHAFTEALRTRASQTAPVPETAPALQTAPVRDRAPARSETAPAPQTPPVSQTGAEPVLDNAAADILASLPHVDGYLRTPNVIEDYLLPQLEPYEQLVYRRLFRLSHGYAKTPVEWAECTVGIPKIAEKTRLSDKTVQRSLRSLEAKGLLVRRGIVPGTAGVTYAVRTPVLRTGAVRRTGGTQQTAPVSGTAIKTHEHEIAKAVDAGKAELSVYEIRTVAARILEAHRQERDFGLRQLRSRVADALVAQGQTATAAVIDQATHGMLKESD